MRALVLLLALRAQALVLVPAIASPRCRIAVLQMQDTPASPFSDDQIAQVMKEMPVDWEESLEDRRSRAIQALEASGVGQQAVLRDEWASSQEVSSWYDAGVRLDTPDEPINIDWSPPPPPPEVELEPLEQTKITASAEASLAAGLLSGIAVLGIDIGGLGVMENLDTAVLVGGIALSQVDEENPVGTTLRTVGNVTSTVATEVVVPTATGVADFVKENELGLKSRAVLELGLEAAILALNPKRKEAEKLAQQYDAAVAVAMEVRAKRDAVPVWSLQERWALDEEVRAAEDEALRLRRAAQQAQREA